MPDAADLVILGDSLAAGWPLDLLAEAAGSSSIFPFGVPGDRIQNVLWRLATVPTGHLRPRHCVALLGTNNLGDGDDVEAIAAGLADVVAAIRRLWAPPGLHLATIPWRAPRPTFREDERRRLNEVLLPGLARRDGFALIDADDALGRGRLSANFLPDGLHLSVAGYEALTGTLYRALSCLPRADTLPIVSR